MSDEFKPTTEILTRSELTVIWNYWTGKYNLLLHTQKPEGDRTIADYLKELTVRDKELITENRSNLAKRRAEEKRQAKEEAQRKKCEEEQFKRQKKLVFDDEFPAFDKECSVINDEIQRLQKQIIALEQKKKILQSGFQSKCVHRFGKEISDQYHCNKWVICEICQYREFTNDD